MFNAFVKNSTLKILYNLSTKKALKGHHTTTQGNAL